jgi:transmembrane sensor
LIIIFFALYFINKESETSKDVSVAMIEKANDKGQKTKIHLPDGSTVILNSSSKLLYPASFMGEKREVFLSGEAFFEIVPDTVKPFVVKTTDLTARVLGTSFNINAYDNREGHSVSIVTGVVEVSANNQNTLVMTQGEKAQIQQGSGEIRQITFNYENDILWKDGILVFRKTPFREVVQRLEQWYGVDFIIDRLPEIELPVTGKFDNEYLSNILHSISFTARFRYEIKGNEVYIQFN